MKKLLKEFKAFALKGNVLDLAVGVIIGGAFTAIVTTLTESVLQPILDFIFTGGNTEFQIGTAFSAVLTAVVHFVITALVLFLIVKGINGLTSLGKKKEEAPAPTTKKCPYCCTEIDIKATRCPHCTSQLPEEKK